MPRLIALCCVALLCACTSLPGRDYPRKPSPVAAQAANPQLVQPFLAAELAHGTESGFRLYSVGIDGLLLRLELIDAAHSSLDLQYYVLGNNLSRRPMGILPRTK